MTASMARGRVGSTETPTTKEDCHGSARGTCRCLGGGHSRRTGGLANALGILRDAGANLQFIIARRAPTNRRGVLFVTPLEGDREIAAAAEAGFNVTHTLHSVRAMGRDRRASPRS